MSDKFISPPDCCCGRGEGTNDDCERCQFIREIERLKKLVMGSGDSRIYSAAGELFGYLRKGLGFGDLVMFERTWGDSTSPQAISYRWGFDANGKRHGIEHTVSIVELEHIRSVDAFAFNIITKWKASIRCQE